VTVSPFFQRWWQNLSFTAADGGNAQDQITALTTTVAGKVAKATFSGYGAPSGTLDRTTFATYAAPTVSNPPTQAEVQALANAVQALSRHLAAVITDLKT
jgi:hypothetical protein